MAGENTGTGEGQVADPQSNKDSNGLSGTPDDPTGGTSANKLTLRVRGQEVEHDLSDPRTVEFLQKGYDYEQEKTALNQQREQLQQSIDLAAQAKAQELNNQQAMTQEEMRLRQLEQEDPYMAEIERLKKEVQNTKQTAEQQIQEMRQGYQQIQWEQIKLPVAAKHPEFSEDDWTSVYLRMNKEGIDIGEAANRHQSGRAAYKQSIIDDYTKTLKENKQNLPPAPGDGSGAPIPTQQQQGDGPPKSFRESGFLGKLKDFMDGQDGVGEEV